MDQDMRLFCENLTRMTVRLSSVSAILLLFLASGSPCHAAQTPSTTSEANAVAVLHPALEEVSSALRQIQIDHWKISRDWKGQFSNDANSIQQDLNGTLPGLFQEAQQSPTTLESQFVVMHNVDALYNVLVRLTTAADLCGGKADSAVLNNAAQH